MRSLYALVSYALVPVLLLRLWWRGRREPGYRQNWRERLGYYAFAPAREHPLIWIHAVSLGETRAAQPLLAALLSAYPRAQFLLTHSTATGRAAGRALCSERVMQAWLPWDTPSAVRRFYQRVQPTVGILIETEIWPQLLREARRRGIPVFLANARLSERSARGYARLGSFAREAFAGLAGVAAQAPTDAARLSALGAPAPVITGNLKFDCAVPLGDAVLGSRLRGLWGEERTIWVAGSTREGEEELLLEALRAERPPEGPLLVIVPRHPQRFAAVEALLQRGGWRYARRSEARPLAPDVQIVLGDSMGEMFAYYVAADFVFVGGSLLPFGCQNLIEACAAGKPVLFGPSVFNFAQAAALAIEAGAARQVSDARALVRAGQELAADGPLRLRMGTAALAFCASHRGAVNRLLSWLQPALEVRLNERPRSD